MGSSVKEVRDDQTSISKTEAHVNEILEHQEVSKDAVTGETAHAQTYDNSALQADAMDNLPDD